jgi:hypothetical protein
MIIESCACRLNVNSWCGWHRLGAAKTACKLARHFRSSQYSTVQYSITVAVAVAVTVRLSPTESQRARTVPVPIPIQVVCNADTGSENTKHVLSRMSHEHSHKQDRPDTYDSLLLVRVLVLVVYSSKDTQRTERHLLVLQYRYRYE